MQIQVTFRHVEPSQTLKDYAWEKVAKIQKYIDGPLECSVTLGVEKHRHVADVTIIAAGLKIHGSETTGDLYSAIDLVTDKLDKQLKRYRDKLRKFTRTRRPGTERPYSLEVVEAASVGEADTPRIIKSDRLTAKPMDVDEAAMQLDLSQDDFLVFINSGSEMINVLYRRSDGNFGLIEPQ